MTQAHSHHGIKERIYEGVTLIHEQFERFLGEWDDVELAVELAWLEYCRAHHSAQKEATSNYLESLLGAIVSEIDAIGHHGLHDPRGLVSFHVRQRSLSFFELDCLRIGNTAFLPQIKWARARAETARSGEKKKYLEDLKRVNAYLREHSSAEEGTPLHALFRRIFRACTVAAVELRIQMTHERFMFATGTAPNESEYVLATLREMKRQILKGEVKTPGEMRYAKEKLLRYGQLSPGLEADIQLRLYTELASVPRACDRAPRMEKDIEDESLGQAIMSFSQAIAQFYAPVEARKIDTALPLYPYYFHEYQSSLLFSRLLPLLRMDCHLRWSGFAPRCVDRLKQALRAGSE